MAKAALKIDQQRLEDCVCSVESAGPLSSLVELWDKVAVAYNAAGKPVKLPPISKSAAMLHVKEWGIKIKTVAGKRGRQAGQAGGKKTGITVLVSLGDFTSRTVVRGKNIGSNIESRPVICADKYNWILANEKSDGTFDSSRLYLPSFRLVFLTLEEMGVWSDDIPGKVCAKLSSITGRRLELDLKNPPTEIGKQIDRFYKTSFCFYPDVFQRLFKVEPEEPDGDEVAA